MTDSQTDPERSNHRAWLAGIVIVLVVLHGDFWNWADRTLCLGFLPAGLAYHLLYSLGCALLWWWASRYAWPSELEVWASTCDDEERAA
ncbi:MAG: hypothetical protein H6833_07270 [Planctomycetes bacterium]|nr:hypothetical protein [Planctomycetota bacterium]